VTLSTDRIQYWLRVGHAIAFSTMCCTIYEKSPSRFEDNFSWS
jgi:hypothetical protein